MSNTLPATYLMGMETNDSIHLKHGQHGVIAERHLAVIPAGETWTMGLLSEQFYTPFQDCNPQEAMWHFVVTADGFEINVYTQMLRCQEVPTDDGCAYYAYRSFGEGGPGHPLVGVPIVGPATVRVYAFNQTGRDVIFYWAAMFQRRKTDG